MLSKPQNPVRPKEPFKKFVELLESYGWSTTAKPHHYQGCAHPLPAFCPVGHRHDKSLEALNKQVRNGGTTICCPGCGIFRDQSSKTQVKRRKEKFLEFKVEAEMRGFEMLSTWEDYETNLSIMKLRCKRAHEIENTWSRFQMEVNGCKQCTYDEKLVLTYDDIKAYIESKGCTLLSTREEYRRVDRLIKIQCGCGAIKMQSFHNFRQAKGLCCGICSLSYIFEFSSGRQEYIQGYENLTIEELLAGPHDVYGEINEDDMIVGEEKVPPVAYAFKGKDRLYYPDLWVPSKNLYIETKSERIYNVEPARNKAKFDAVCRAGFNFECWFFDDHDLMRKTTYKLVDGDVCIFEGWWEQTLLCELRRHRRTKEQIADDLKEKEARKLVKRETGIHPTTRKSYEEYSAFLEERGWKMVTKLEDYAAKTNSDILCPKGHIRDKTFSGAQRQVRLAGRLICAPCGVTKPDDPGYLARRKERFEKFLALADKKGWTMVSPFEDFMNNNSKMEMICPKGHEEKKTLISFQKGKQDCPVCYSEKKPKYTLEDAQRIVKEKGCKLLSTDYRTVLDILEIRCACGKIKKQSLHTFMTIDGRCKHCQNK